MLIVLHMPPELAYIAYSISCVTAPLLGVILGGAVTHMAGGYTHPNSMRLLTCVSLLGTIVALPLPFLTSWKAYIAVFWFCLFLGGFIMPGLTGIMINAAPKRHRAIGNSVAYFSYNLFGFIPGPLVYGIVQSYTGTESRLGMTILVYSLIISFCFLWLACCGMSSMKTEKDL